MGNKKGLTFPALLSIRLLTLSRSRCFHSSTYFPLTVSGLSMLLLIVLIFCMDDFSPRTPTSKASGGGGKQTWGEWRRGHRCLMKGDISPHCLSVMWLQSAGCHNLQISFCRLRVDGVKWPMWTHWEKCLLKRELKRLKVHLRTKT